MNTRMRKITMIGMLCAISYIVMMVGRVPVVAFLKYDPKDVIITIGGFLFGPIASFVISTIVSFLEMLTVSSTGPIGCIMNIIASCCFACTAAFIYKKKHNLSGAVIGLIAGCLLMTISMIAWNYLITPIYLKVPREVVVKMLIPTFLPFNLLKGGINVAVTLLIYKPIVTALRRTRLLDGIQSNKEKKGKTGKGKSIGVFLVSLLLLATCIFFVLVLRGII